MSIASSQQSFLVNVLTPPLNFNPLTRIPKHSVNFNISCELKDSSGKKENQLAKLAIVTLATGVLSLGSVSDALAAKTGGRVGGQAFRPSPPPRSSSPRINNSRTNIYINPPVAPPLVGGYGYGVPFYGGWGWSPFSFFAPGPSAAIGIGGGFEVVALFMFLGAAAAVLRKFIGSPNEDDDESY